MTKSKFIAWDRRHGYHEAETFTFSTEEERDKKSSSLKKEGGVLYVKNKNFIRPGFVLYGTTVHRGKVDSTSKDWISYKKE